MISIIAGTFYFGWKEYAAVLAAKNMIHPEALYIHILGLELCNTHMHAANPVIESTRSIISS